MAKARISIGTWAYLFNQTEPTNDFHVILHKLQDLGYDGVELGSFGPHPSPASHPTKASRAKLKKEIADHGLALSGIAVDLWAFKVPYIAFAMLSGAVVAGLGSKALVKAMLPTGVLDRFPAGRERQRI